MASCKNLPYWDTNIEIWSAQISNLLFIFSSGDTCNLILVLSLQNTFCPLSVRNGNMFFVETIQLQVAVPLEQSH